MGTVAVTPKLRAGKPVRRRNRWTLVSHPFNGPVWRLDGTDWDLEFDPLDHSGMVTGRWFLYRDGLYAETLDHYLDGSMEWSERTYDAAIWAALGGDPL